MSGFKSLKTDLLSFWRGEQCSTFTLVAISLLATVVFAALAIDLGNAYVMHLHSVGSTAISGAPACTIRI
jgi:hypothetical protein